MMAGRIFTAMLACALFGGWVGYTLKGQAAQAGQVKQAQVAIKKSAQNVVVSVAESGRIETEVAKSDSNVDSIKAAIVKRGVTLHPKQEPHVASAPNNDARDDRGADEQPTTTAVGAAPLAESACPGGSDFVLDRGTVRLLDAARAGRGVDAAGSSDEAQSAPSAVAVTDLIGNDLDVVRMYHDLAKRHDELVDAVEKHLKDQAR